MSLTDKYITKSLTQFHELKGIITNAKKGKS